MVARRQIVTLSVSAAAIAMLAVPVTDSSARFVWNLTPSAPIGLYRIERDGWRVGDRVAVLPSQALAEDLDKRGVLPEGKFLIKRIAAGAGDKVCRKIDEVSVNDRALVRAKASGSGNASLPSWQGCMTLDADEVFLLGDTADSYDGRYFGVTSARDIVGRVAILASF